jgi:energy-converting hydrogenase Eha subunit E
MDFIKPYITKFNEFSMKFKTVSILQKVVPALNEPLSQVILPKLAPLGFDINGVALLLVSVVVFIFLAIAALLGLLKFLISAISLTLVTRRSIIAIATNGKETKTYLVYFVIFSFLHVLESSALAVFLDVIPFYGLVKAVFLFFCSTPETGLSLKLFAIVQPFFGPAPKAGEATKEVEQPKFVCTVRNFDTTVSLEADASVYCVVQFSHDKDLRFVTPVKKGDALKLPVPKGYPKTSSEITFTAMSKQQFGSDVTIGGGTFKLDDSFKSGAVTDLKLNKDGEGGGEKTQTGTLSIQLTLS